MPAVSHFTEVEYGNPHSQRMREILAKHPEVRKFFRPVPRTAFYTLLIVALQLALGYGLHHAAWWILLPVAYLVGAVANHALYVVIHECTHNLVFKSEAANRLLGIFANFPLMFPSAMPFVKYHRLHHTNQAEYDHDADLAAEWEARWIGNSTWRKLAAMSCFGLIQGLIRPSRLKGVPFWDKWIALNFAAQIAFGFLFYQAAGWQGLLYLTLSTLFCLGLHPLGGRWIQEHYILQGGQQETYSYYGPLNKLCFNMGYHNEHHDFPKVPWVHLPALKKMAPEYYDPLISYRSWVWVLWKYITDPAVTPYSRVVRPSHHLKNREQSTVKTGDFNLAAGLEN